MARGRDRLVYPLDYASFDEARVGARAVAEHVGVLKVGLELFTREGPRAVAIGGELGRDVFLDLKLHDIPETVARAVAAAGGLGARFLTVHASGGAAMLARAAEAAEQAGGRMTVLAVTVLTSLDAGDLEAQGVAVSVRDQVLRLARIAWKAGIRGFVASSMETEALRAELGPEALIVTPGIRPEGAEASDQRRVATPAMAIAAGADLLVVGRPIRDAADPREAARAIVTEIEAAEREVDHASERETRPWRG